MDGLRRLALQGVSDFGGFDSDLGEYETIEVRTCPGSETKLSLGNTTSVVNWMRSASNDNNHVDATYYLKVLKIPCGRSHSLLISR